MMETLYLLIPLSVALVFAIGAVFWWGTRHGQFDDLDGPGQQILDDDDRPLVAAALQRQDSGSGKP